MFPGCAPLRRHLRTALLALGVGLAPASPLLADASAMPVLPSIGLGPPEGILLGLPHTDPVLAPHVAALHKAGQKLQAARSEDELRIARRNLEAILDGADAAVAAAAGPSGRLMAEYLSATLAHTEIVRSGSVPDRARHAVAIERQVAANADFFGTFLSGTEWSGVVTARQTSALARTIDHLLRAADEATRSGKHGTARENAALAFALAQAAYTGEAARGAVQRLRLSPGRDPAEALRHGFVHDLAGMIRETSWLQDELDFGALAWWPQAEAVARDAVAQSREAILSALATVDEIGLDVAAALYPAPLPLTTVQAALAPDEVLVLLVPSDIHVAVFAVTDDALHWHWSGADWVQLMDLVDDLRAGLGVADTRGATSLVMPDAPARSAAIAHRLYLELLGPAGALLEGHPRLMVTATHVMARFPFEMLVVTPPDPGADFASMDWLVRHHAVTHLPAVELVLHRMRPVDGPLRYLGFGAPDYNAASDAPLAGHPVTAMVAGLRPLPESADEVRAVAGLFDEGRAQVVLGADAVEAVLLQGQIDGTLGAVDVLHFATHGLARGDHPVAAEAFLALAPTVDHLQAPTLPTFNDHSLILGDGALWAREIAGLGMNARLVILSACNSAMPDPYTLHGLGGLAAAFLQGGAQRVLASHWPVNSRAAVEIVTAMMAADPGLDDPAMALRQALLAQIDRGGATAHPAYWAPFSLIGAP